MTNRAVVLIANNLGDLHLEDGQLMPIFKKRQRQEESDLCVLDKDYLKRRCKDSFTLC